MTHLTLTEQERLAYMAGDIRTAQLLALADEAEEADTEAEKDEAYDRGYAAGLEAGEDDAKAEASKAAERLADALHDLIHACTGVDYMEDAYADELAAARKALADYQAKQ